MASVPPVLQHVFQSAVRALETSDFATVENLCQQMLADNSRPPDVLHLLGIVLSRTGRLEEAIALMREALAGQSNNPILWTNLGRIYREVGRPQEAIECHRRAIALHPNFAEAHFNLGLAFRAVGDFDAAIGAMHRSTELRPNYAQGHYNLGNFLREEGRLRRALEAYQTALGLRPAWPDAHLNLAVAYHEFGQPDKAVEHFREVLRLDPARTDVEFSIGHGLMAQGQVAEAKAAYERGAATSSKPAHRDPMSRLFRESLAEVIVPDQAAIAEFRARVTAAIDRFAAEPGTIDLADLHWRGAMPSMMLAYYGGNVRPIMEQYARAIEPHIPRIPLAPRTGKPKLGIVVTHGHEGIFARLWGGICERLSREKFDVRLICTQPGANILQTLLKLPPDEYLRLPTGIEESASLLCEQRFDWLHYWEIGTDQVNYYLPFFRVAPGQSACRGWPVTTGNPHVTSYLSSELVESADGPSHYTEQLILLKRLPTYYARPAELKPTAFRARLGLRDDEHAYLCAQNLRKFHPDFDPVLAEILRTDERGTLLIVADPQPPITDLLLARFRRTMPDVVSRIRVLPRTAHDEYMSLLGACDVLLDTLHYGGDTTAYDAAVVGAPLLTLPGDFHRSRWCAAISRLLGVEQLSAGSTAEYVAKAIAVATSADLNQSLRRQILQANAVLFDDQQVVREHEEFFSNAIAASR